MPQRPSSSASSRPRVDGRRPNGEVRPVDAGGAGALDEERDPQRVLARALVPFAGPLDAGGDVDADRRGRPERVADGRPDRGRRRGRPGSRGQRRRRATARRGCRCRPGGGRRRCRAAGVRRRPSRNSRPRATIGVAAASTSDGSSRGRWMTFQAGRPTAAIDAGGSRPDSWTASGSRAATISRIRSSPAIGGDGDDLRRRRWRAPTPGRRAAARSPRRATAPAACPGRG